MTMTTRTTTTSRRSRTLRRRLCPSRRTRRTSTRRRRASTERRRCLSELCTASASLCIARAVRFGGFCLEGMSRSTPSELLEGRRRAGVPRQGQLLSETSYGFFHLCPYLFPLSSIPISSVPSASTRNGHERGGTVRTSLARERFENINMDHGEAERCVYACVGRV